MIGRAKDYGMVYYYDDKWKFLIGEWRHLVGCGPDHWFQINILVGIKITNVLYFDQHIFHDIQDMIKWLSQMRRGDSTLVGQCENLGPYNKSMISRTSTKGSAFVIEKSVNNKLFRDSV